MSTTTKFTPGPWLVFDHYCGRDPETAGEYAEHRLIGIGQFDTVADVRHGHDEIEGDVDANARLIAAAPELYAVADEAEQLFRDLTGKVNEAFLDRFAALHFNARAALGKARGEA